MSCADARRLASSGYLLLDAYPARMIPYTPTDATDTMYRRPTLMSVMYRVTCRPNRLTSGPKGITAYTMRAGTIEMIGATVNTHLSARVGVMSSLIISFTASAIG